MPTGGRGASALPRECRPEPARRRAAFVAPFADLLEQVRAAGDAGVYCLFPQIDAHHGEGVVEIDGRRAVSLIANDYLGLSAHPAVRAAAREAIDRLGASRCASPLVGGHTGVHRDLEAELCDFLEQEACVAFASGYQANVGIVSALMGPGDLVVTDLFDHASIVDGARLSGADVRFFNHNDGTHLRRVLERAGAGRRVLVIVEGVYSADGDVVDLPEICEAAHDHEALVMVDEAHSLGVLGEHGRGAAEHHGLLDAVDLVMGTMSKSLAGVGGFAAGDEQLIAAIRHRARALIFSAALPPPNAAACLTALRLLRAEPDLRERLWRNTRVLRDALGAAGLDVLGADTPVVPVLVGDMGMALAYATRLRERGVLVCPAIPPMVQAHLSRVRMHATAAHSPADLERAIETLVEVAGELGVPRRTAQAGGRS